MYDASGAKLRKITIDNSTATPVTVTTEYINGVEYRNNVTQRIANAEGQITRTATATYQKEFVLRDHLGNTRVTFCDLNNDGLVNDAEILQSNNYYAFGLNMEMNTNGAQGNNKYQYNGKEWNDDFGLGLNDYGARMYDPAIGRWNSVDPLAEKMRRYSPYNYGFDNPIKTIDPDGMMGMNFDAGGGSEGHTGEARSGYQESGGFSHDNEQANSEGVSVGGLSDFKSGEEHNGSGAPINNQGSKNDNNSQLFSDPEGKKSNFQEYRREDRMVLAGKAGETKGGGDDPGKKNPVVTAPSDFNANLPIWAQVSLNQGGTIAGMAELNTAKAANQLKRLESLNNMKAGFEATFGATGYQTSLKASSTINLVGRFAGRGLAVYGAITTVSDVAAGRKSYSRGAADLIMTGVGVWGGPIGLGVSAVYFIGTAVYDYNQSNK